MSASRLRVASAAFAVFAGLAVAACSRVPEEPNPVVKEMRPMPGKAIEASPPPPAPGPGTTSMAAPSPQCPPDPNPSLNDTLYGRGEASFVTPDAKTHTFAVEIARTEKAQARGLMYRTSLAEDAGMVFEFAYPHQASFWMRNTCIPLDMVFVSEDALVIGVVTAPPLNEASRGVPGLSKWVVELAAGVAKKRGIGIGTRFVPPKP